MIECLIILIVPIIGVLGIMREERLARSNRKVARFYAKRYGCHEDDIYEGKE